MLKDMIVLAVIALEWWTLHHMRLCFDLGCSAGPDMICRWERADEWDLPRRRVYCSRMTYHANGLNARDWGQGPLNIWGPLASTTTACEWSTWSKNQLWSTQLTPGGRVYQALQYPEYGDKCTVARGAWQSWLQQCCEKHSASANKWNGWGWWGWWVPREWKEI